jgi:hypothetical protein
MLTIRVDSYHFGNGKTVGPLTQPERGEVNEPKMELIGIQKQEINRLAKSEEKYFCFFKNRRSTYVNRRKIRANSTPSSYLARLISL